MIKLKISQFSCIDDAELFLSPLTVLTGPQASGKSVLSKLIYYFQQAVSYAFRYVDSKLTLDRYIVQLSEDFKSYFPPTAWGNGRFIIIYDAGPLQIEITRRGNRKSEKINIRFSEEFANLFNATMETFHNKLSALKESSDKDLTSNPFDLQYQTQNAYRQQLSSFLRDDHVAYQIFVPAGRSFFTSLGKAIAAFEHGGMLDPVTISFGRFFAATRERGNGRIFFARSEKDDDRHAELTKELFGGEIKFERDQEYVASKDGRIIPFSALSSGQQELLPLWLTLDTFGAFRDQQQLIYIEEPEAHLFPSAQSAVIKYLMRIVSNRSSKNKLIITTHSPYMLAQINNLMKAGALAASRSRDLGSAVDRVIPREYWLRPKTVQAFAIVDRKLVSINDKDGQIDAEYMDRISGDIAYEFDKLLEIEYAK